MKLDSNTFERLVRELVSRHGFMVTEPLLCMSTTADPFHGYQYTLQSRPAQIVGQVAVQPLLLMSNEAGLNHIKHHVALTAAALRGKIVRDIILGDAPVDLVDDHRGTDDEVMQRCEQVATALLARVERLSK